MEWRIRGYNQGLSVFFGRGSFLMINRNNYNQFPAFFNGINYCEGICLNIKFIIVLVLVATAFRIVANVDKGFLNNIYKV